MMQRVARVCQRQLIFVFFYMVLLYKWPFLRLYTLLGNLIFGIIFNDNVVFLWDLIAARYWMVAPVGL